MDVYTYSEARQRLKDLMDRVVEDQTHAVVTRRKAEAVVMVSLSAWNSMEETLHLVSNPTNARRLRESIEELDADGGQERELIER